MDTTVVVEAVKTVSEVTGMNIIDYITYILAGFGCIEIIVRATPTKKDDQIVSKIGKILIASFEEMVTDLYSNPNKLAIDSAE